MCVFHNKYKRYFKNINILLIIYILIFQFSQLVWKVFLNINGRYVNREEID